ncbi:hypothetical protein GGI12_001926, partial [Dipsacomyces acuminosporus]
MRSASQSLAASKAGTPSNIHSNSNSYGDGSADKMDLLSNAATIASSTTSATMAAAPAARPNSNPTISNEMAMMALAHDNDSAMATDTIKVARNWSRDETLSLVRAIGRHYESLRRCKTNQERSNVWHRIHKEHSTKFPGRSKKASQ